MLMFFTMEKLRQLLKSLSKAEREELATEADTTVPYLFQIAGGHRSASHHLAGRIEKAVTNKKSKNHMVTKEDLRPDIYQVNGESD